MILADSLPLADPVWGLQLLVYAGIFMMFAGGIVGIVVSLRRKPSYDVDLARMAKDMESMLFSLNEFKKDTKERLDSGATVHVNLQKDVAVVRQEQAEMRLQQQINSQVVKDTNDKEEQRDFRIERQMTAMSKRIDEAIRDVFCHAKDSSSKKS